ncbi:MULTISPECIES: beta-keto acid cleavage family enzyme [Paraburkholderia]|uniref:3-keto-5-aminohexanoate cleavage protein n=1 Tax=Paraburkholderia metrosideri TaxID=580937 RepID=A0ABW9E1F6_9BURK
MNKPVVITCALNGIFTDPQQFNVPVTPEQMAREARGAYDAGASCMHIHFRRQEDGKGHLPSWDPELASEINQAIREACPGVILNQTTGIIGPDIDGPLSCIHAIKPEIAACNAGSLNYLKVKTDGTWAWPPLMFDNPVKKIQSFLEMMEETGSVPEFECFDVGIVRCVDMYARAGLFKSRANYNFVMGVESGMPAHLDLLPILIGLLRPDSNWQVTAIGRSNIWALHRRTAELGGQLRTGLEDTFYLPDGERATSNAYLIEAMANIAREAGREIASPREARKILGVRAEASSPV